MTVFLSEQLSLVAFRSLGARGTPVLDLLRVEICQEIVLRGLLPKNLAHHLLHHLVLPPD